MESVFTVSVPVLNTRTKKYTWMEIAWHEDKQMISKFMTQHQFTNVKVLAEEPSDDKNDREHLDEHIFHSNYTSDEYIVITNDELMTRASDYVADKLSNTCVFGNLIVENKIPIVDIVNKLLDRLPFVEIIDYSLMDEINDASMEHIKSGNYEAYDGRTPDNESYETRPGDWIFDTLRDSLCPYDKPEPITLEGYIEYVASWLTDEPDEEER